MASSQGVRFAEQAGNDISPNVNGYGALTHFELWHVGVPPAQLDWSLLVGRPGRSGRWCASTVWAAGP